MLCSLVNFLQKLGFSRGLFDNNVRCDIRESDQTVLKHGLVYSIRPTYTFYIYVLQFPKSLCLSRFATIVDKPEVSIVTPRPVVEGQNVTITCQSVARPAVTNVTWKKGQNVITVTGDGHFGGGTVQKPSLTIDLVTRTDAGEYTCEMSNIVGKGKESVELQVWCKYLVSVHGN